MPEDVIGSAWIKIAPDLSTFENQLLGGVGTSVKKVAGALAVLAIPAYAIKSAADYDQSLASIAAHAGLTRQQVNGIGAAFLSTGGSVTFSANAIAQAYAPVAGQLGLVEGHALGARDALVFMRAAMDLAEASGVPLTETTSALAEVMQAYGLTVGQAAAASDLLWNASAALNIPISSLADTVDKLHAKLGPLAPSLADVSTLLFDVATHGLTGSRALLLVSTGMNTLLGGSKSTTAEIKKLNLSLYDANGNFVGMQGVLAQLTPKLAGMTEQQRLFAEKELFGSGASKALDATLLAGLPGWEKSAAAADKTGTAHKAAGVQADTFQGKLHTLESQVGDLATKFGQDLLPMVEGFVGFVSHNLKPIETLSGLILGMYAAKKGVSLIAGLTNDIGGLISKVTGLTGLGSGGASLGMRVYGGPVEVTGLGSIPGGVPATVAADAATVGTDTGVLAAGGLGAAGAGETSVLSGILAGGTVSAIATVAAPAAALAVIAYFGWQDILKENRKTPAQQAKDAKAIRDAVLGNEPTTPHGKPTGLGTFDDTPALKAIQVSAAKAKTEWNDLVLLARGGKQDWNEFFTSLGVDLKTTLQKGSNLAIASDDLYELFKAGKIKNATQLQTWEDDWNRIQIGTGKNAGFAEGLATNMELAGKLTDKQVPAFILAFNTLVKDGMNPASITAVDVANEMALAYATTKNLNQTLDTINASADLFARTNRLTLPHGGAPTGPGTTKTKTAGGHTINISQTNTFPHSANPQDVQKVVDASNRRLLIALRTL